MQIPPQTLRAPLVPDRVRRIAGQGFAFLPHRFLRDGFLSALSRDELALYIFLLLAGNRYGVSFYGYDAICTVLQMPLEAYVAARDRLIDLDLLAIDGTRFQVLSLPEHPPAQPEPDILGSQEDRLRRDPATIRAAVRRSFGLDPNDR